MTFLVGCADRPFPGAWKLCSTIRLSVGGGKPLAEEGNEEEEGEERGASRRRGRKIILSHRYTNPSKKLTNKANIGSSDQLFIYD